MGRFFHLQGQNEDESGWVKSSLSSVDLGTSSTYNRTMAKGKPDPKLIARLSKLSDRELGRLLRRSREFANKRPKKEVRQMAPLWTREESALLGTRPDQDLAKLFGRTLTSICVRRNRLKIPCFNPKARRWSEVERKLLGTMSDADLAKQLELSEKRVRGYRESHHVPVFDRQLHQWTGAEDKLLGTTRDEVLAKKWGVTVTAIKHRRTRLRIFTPKELRHRKGKQRPWAPEELALLGKVNDRELGKKLGRWVHFVRWKREELGIATPFRKRWRAEEDAMLGKVPDAQLAKLSGRSVEAVALRRQAMNRNQEQLPDHRWTSEEDAKLGTAPDETIARELGLRPGTVTHRRRFLEKPAWEP